MKYASGLETVEFTPVIGVEEEVDEDQFSGYYMRPSLWLEYKDATMENMKKRIDENSDLRLMLNNETDPMQRIDIENRIKNNERYVQSRKERMDYAKIFENSLLFGIAYLESGKIEPIWERVGSEMKKIAEKSMTEMLVASYA